MNVQIRLRQAADLDACVRALAEVHEIDAYPMRWPADPAGWLTVPGTLVALVADLDSRVVAHGLVRTASGTEAAASLASASGRPVDEIAMVSRLYVAPSGRRRGVGRALLNALAQAASELGVVLGLDVVDKDEAAIAMYERAGWRRVAAIPSDWAVGRQMFCYLAPEEAARSPRRHNRT